MNSLHHTKQKKIRVSSATLAQPVSEHYKSVLGYGQVAQLPRCHRNCDARLQSSYRLLVFGEPIVVTKPLRRQSDRHPEIGIGIEEIREACWHNPNDLIRLVVKDYRSLQHVWIGAETQPPEPVAEHYDVLVAG